MIGAPDVVALTKEEPLQDSYSDIPSLPEEYSVSLFPFANDANPWSKHTAAKFTKDFILISEFSEQVGPQPLLTIPEDSRVYENFDLNYFSLRIMSVDYQASFVGHPPGTSYPKLNFVEDSKVVLGDSKEGAFAYVHHLTLYDLEARGFVRPFCIAYITTDEDKIMQQFLELSAEFSKASECLKTGNRKAFANELVKKLKDLEYTRGVLHNEMELENKTNDLAFYTSQGIDKANEWANVNKSIVEHQELLQQIQSYPYRKLKETEFFPYEPDVAQEQSTVGLDQIPEACDTDAAPEDGGESDVFPRRPSYTPKFIKAKSAKCFDKKLKTLEELCDSYFFSETVAQLTRIEKKYRGDVCYLLESQIDRALLKQLNITNFLFEDPSLWEEPRRENLCDPILDHVLGTLSPKLLEEPQGFKAPASMGSYKSSVEAVPIKMDPDVAEDVSQETDVTESSAYSNQENSEEGADAELKGSVSSGESIEVLRTEKSASVLTHSESQPCLPLHSSPQVVRRKAVSKRTVSEDSIEVLSTCPSEALIPEDFKASYPSAINEEDHYVDDDEDEGIQLGMHFNSSTLEASSGCENETLPSDSACCIGKESPLFQEPLIDLNQSHAVEYNVVRVPPQPSRQVNHDCHVNFSVNDAENSLKYTAGDMGPRDFDPNFLSLVDTSRVNPDDYSDSNSYISGMSASSDRTASPAHFVGRLTEKQKRKAGQSALRFIRQYPFAHPAIYSLLSGRTLIVLGKEEGDVKKLVTALSIFVPSYNKYAKPVKHWTEPPLHIMDFQRWKLIGLQRVISTTGCNTLNFLNRYIRYASVLDVDSKELRCPLYKGTLLSRMADHRTQIKRGSTYYLHVQSMLTQLCSKAFLYCFCHHLHMPLSANENAESVVSRRMDFLRLQLGLAQEDIKIVKYLAELLKIHYIQESDGSVQPLLRFDYVPSFLYTL